jgi:NAD(P)-dependent dehydrogenase (short-subunit alcohol dehydrogenase family)
VVVTPDSHLNRQPNPSAYQEMKNVLITGANRGIGFETARQLAQRGFHVIIGARSEKQGEKARRELERVGKVSLLAIDVSDSKSISVAADAFAPMGQLDVLINNAGIYPDDGVSILTVSRDAMVSTLQTNTLGPLEVTQRFLTYLKKAPAARVINISSGLGQLDGLEAGIPSYGISKLALNGITIMLADALREFGISGRPDVGAYSEQQHDRRSNAQCDGARRVM